MNRFNLSLPFYAFLLCLSAGSCSKKEKKVYVNEHYEQQYSIVFDKTADSIIANASFIEPGSNFENGIKMLRLSATEKVKLNGIDGVENVSIKGYEWKLKGGFTDVTLELIKANGQTIINQVSKNDIPDIDITSVLPDSVPGFKDLTIYLTAKNITSQDGVVIRLYDSTSNGYALLSVIYSPNTPFVITKSTLQDIKGDFLYIELSAANTRSLPNRDGERLAELNTVTRVMKKLPLKK